MPPSFANLCHPYREPPCDSLDADSSRFPPLDGGGGGGGNGPASDDERTPGGGLLSPRPPTRSEVDACAFSAWYSSHRALTPRAEVIRPLPDDFVSYLLADGIFLPGDLPEAQLESDSDDDDAEQDAEEEETVRTPSFPELEARITSAIRTFGGAVFPKLNWSSPRDAAWMATGASIKCVNAADVFLLLKSSDFIVHDLCHMYDDCCDRLGRGAEEDDAPQYELVLKKWYDISSSMEFRCFVRDRRLIAISQRDMNYYDFLGGLADQIRSMITGFFERQISGTFPNADYVFDVYITRDMTRVWLIDFNVFYHTTDALLFTWDAIMRLPGDAEPEFRLIRSQLEANRHAGSGMAFSTNRYPRDMFDLSNGVTPAEYAASVTREMARQATAVSDEDEETAAG